MGQGFRVSRVRLHLKLHRRTLRPSVVENLQAGGNPVDVYAVQCGKCFKWRVLPTQEQFEDIRSKFAQDPFFCNKKPNVSCEDPADIEYDSSRIWLADKPNIPKTPAGFQRGLYLRKDFSKLDTHYITPAGNKVRSAPGIESFVEENPEYGLTTSDFSFAPPKIMEDTIPEHIDRKGSGSGSKQMKSRKTDEA